MARKPARRPARSSRKTRRGRLVAPGTEGDWLKRWEASVPFAAARYAAAVRDRAEQMVDKYIESLKRSLIQNAKRREQCRGA